MVSLREKWNAIDAEEFQDTTESVCAACGQNLPTERVETAREKAKAAFNSSKAERLATVQESGKQRKIEYDRLLKE